MVSVDLLNGLSPRQAEAASHVEGPLLIVAGPGSGKTRVIAHRVAYLIGEHGVSPRNILAVTFTNKAARELRQRCEMLVPGSVDYLQVRTFHGFCAIVLRTDGGRIGVERTYTIYDDDDQVRTIRRILEEMDVDTKRFTPRSVLANISRAKNLMVDDASFARDVNERRYHDRSAAYFHELTARTYTRYTELLDTARAVDFDDLLLKTLWLFESAPDILDIYQDRFPFLLVDEFQDTNPLQLKIANLLASKRRNICVVGDPDQSIYSWRHADPANLLDFQKTYPDARVVTLDQSYRSTQLILEGADSVIANNTSRLHKTLWTENERGSEVVVAEAYDEDEEARAVLSEVSRLSDKEGIERANVAVMYRVNAQSRAMEVACNRSSVPYRLVGGTKFYERKEVRDILCYLRLTLNPADDAALERVINVPARGIGGKTVEEARRAARAAGTPMLDPILSLAGAAEDAGDGGRAAQEVSGRDIAGRLRATLRPQALKSLAAFAALMQRLIEQSLALSPSELIDLILERSDYSRMLQDDQDRGEERWENVRELRGSAEQYDGTDPRSQLAEFLESVALVADVDSLDSEGPSDAMTLITLHQAKGLEFDAVFIIGLEEGLLPHSRSLDDPAQLEEERRLCYVGMTRARNRLYLLHAFKRGFRGTRIESTPSRFIGEIPPELVSSRLIRRPGGRAPVMPRDPMAVKHAATLPAPRRATRPSVAYGAGDKVRHSHFGDGIVISAIEAHGDTEVTVAFGAGYGVKRLMLNFAPLERIEPSARAVTEEEPDPVLDTP